MPRQGFSWGPIIFVIVTLLASVGLITWGLSSSTSQSNSTISNPPVQSEG